MTALIIALLVVQAEPPPKKFAFVGVQISARIKPDVLVISGVLPDSPAEKAGVKGGDVLLKINGVRPADLKTAVDVFRALKPGKKATVRVLRDGKERDIEVVPIELRG
jgi:S1-C subfamily serine protease